MNIKKLVSRWFEVWTNGDFHNIPVTTKFEHTIPYGTVSGKSNYLELVRGNKEQFLGHNFEIHDEIYQQDRACIRYTVSKNDFSMEVTEWHYIKDELIDRIIAYYNIEGEISEDRVVEGYDT